MAAALLDVAVGQIDELSPGERPIVSSAGLLEGGRPVPSEVVAAMAPFGVDMTPHRSTALTAEAVERADLVVALERRHGREAVLLVPSALARTVTLKELVRRGEKAGPRPAGQTLAAWLAVVLEGRGRNDLIGRSPEDDVADPFGASPADYRATAAEIADLVQRMTRLLWLDAGPADS
jgi:protein-tyrosine phosphatase